MPKEPVPFEIHTERDLNGQVWINRNDLIIWIQSGSYSPEVQEIMDELVEKLKQFGIEHGRII